MGEEFGGRSHVHVQWVDCSWFHISYPAKADGDIEEGGGAILGRYISTESLLGVIYKQK